MPDAQDPRTPPPHQSQYNPAFPTFSDPALSRSPDRSSPESGHSHIQASPAQQISHSQRSSASTIAASVAGTSNPSNGNSMLSVVNGNASAMSRDSRITLPDEARQYIVNMVPSPIPSPHVAGFNHGQASAASEKSHFSADLPTPTPNTVPSSKPTDNDGGSGEFLDMDEDPGDEDGDEESIDQDTMENSAYPSSSYSDLSATQFMAAQTTGLSGISAVDDFPLPPTDSSAAQAQAMQAGYSNGYATAPPRAASLPQSDPFANPSHSALSSSEWPDATSQSEANSPDKRGQPSQGPVPFPSGAPAPKNPPFRALPLLSSDLPHTSIIVTNSFVRPNDRGKEIMSFVIQVNPGSGKDSWKTEKTHSDIVGLDQRVRSSVSKNVVKRIATLPEGKLWRDHAPAKVDQRKVCIYSEY
jgi:RalA-binding protein 1